MRRFFTQGIGILVAGVVALGGLQPVWADTIISNFPQANDDSGSTLSNANGVASKAAGFTMPNNGLAYTLDSVTLRLKNGDPNADLLVELFGDGGTGPVGPSLVTFTNPVIPVGTGDFMFVPDASFTLQPLTTYWITATGESATPAPGINWEASLPGITPTGLASSAGYRFSSIGSGVVPPTGRSTVSNTYQVDATPVRIPSTLLLFGLGFAGFAVWRHRLENRESY